MTDKNVLINNIKIELLIQKFTEEFQKAISKE